LARLTVFAKTLLPWSPDIDSRRLDKPGIITGTNFTDDLDGPQSAFSSNLVNYNYWDASTRRKINELRLTEEIVYGTCTGIWRINETSGVAELLLGVTVTEIYWPWTVAYVGGKYYFAQYDVGLWQYDPETQVLTYVVNLAGDNIRYVAESAGRLICLTPTDVLVSALDDGTDLTPSITTGAHAQTLSLVGGQAYAIVPVPDGYLVYQSNGVMKATFTQAAFVFTYDNLTAAVKLFSPNASVYVPLLGSISLDNSGFHIVKEARSTTVPEPWEIEKGDYIKQNILAYLNKNLVGTVCLYYSQAEQKLFVSFSDNTREGVMIACFVYSFVSQRWGSFDIQQTGLFETLELVNNAYSCSYIALDGFMRAFSHADYSQNIPDAPDGIADFLYRPTQEEQPIKLFSDDGVNFVHIGYTDILFEQYNPTGFNNYTVTNLFYQSYLPYSDTDLDDETDPPFEDGSPIVGGSYADFYTSGGVNIVALPYTLPIIGLNSTLEVGPFRFTEQLQADETSCVNQLILGLSRTANFSTSEDWNTIVGDNEDWNALNGAEDWGSGVTVPNVFELVLNDTDDGTNPGIQGLETLPVFNDLGSSLTYSPIGYSSIYHTITLNAINPREAFALKFVDLTGQLTGSLLQR
jgi:hypothetical protein